MSEGSGRLDAEDIPAHPRARIGELHDGWEYLEVFDPVIRITGERFDGRSFEAIADEGPNAEGVTEAFCSDLDEVRYIRCREVGDQLRGGDPYGLYYGDRNVAYRQVGSHRYGPDQLAGKVYDEELVARLDIEVDRGADDV